jgi:Domain of unknown function (DUF6473)
MMLLQAGAGALDYSPCRYGTSRPLFRGPERDLSRPYLAMLGGTATFGKYVPTPYPELVEKALGLPVANLGGLSAGPDFYLSDPATLAIAARARGVVVQITGAEAMTNPFYSVHSRRNDRVLAASPVLRALFPELDLTDVHFTRHLLLVLQRADSVRFRSVITGLKANWLARMRDLLGKLPPRRVLLWFADTPPPVSAVELDSTTGPLFVDAGMLAELGPGISDLIQAVPSAAAKAEDAARMLCAETEMPQARSLPGLAAHAEVAAALCPALARLV